MFNKKYQSQPTALASYSYEDIADRTGVRTFYGCQTNKSGATLYKLSSQTVYSSSIEVVDDGDPSKELDFDLTAFSIPTTLKGTALLSGSLGGGTGNSGYVTAQLMKVSGVTETAITSVIGTAAVSYNASAKMFLLPIPITETIFKAGEFLRLNIFFYRTAGANNMYFGIDPMGRDGTYATAAAKLTTILKLNIPFGLDL